MADRVIVFYLRQVRKDRTGRYHIGGSATRVDVEPVVDLDDVERIKAWQLSTWLPDPSGAERRNRLEYFNGRFPTILEALRAYAVDRGYDIAVIENRIGIRTQIHPPPGHASGVPP